MENLPLSHTKRGKLLAAIGGLAGGPLGVIVSPLVLMLINASKKEGNRFLIWALSGIPICTGLWLFQFFVILIIGAAIEDQPTSSNDVLRNNGMGYWENSMNAKMMIPSPDWCNYELKFTGFEGYEILTCFARDWNTAEKNDHKVIECVKDPELGKLEFECTELANKQFTEEQMRIVKSDNQ